MNYNTVMKNYIIHPSWYEFFESLEEDDYKNIARAITCPDVIPEPRNIFYFAKRDLATIKVVIMTQEPYNKKELVSSRPFEVPELNSWFDSRIPRSLKNIVKLIYYTNKNEIKSFTEIQEEIKTGKFLIAPPKVLFQKWEWEGVLTLYANLTTKAGHHGSHKFIWEGVVKKLVHHIAQKKKHTHWLLWGRDARHFKKELIGNCVYENSNPAKKSKPDLFYINESFRETRHIVKWTGVVKNKNNT